MSKVIVEMANFFAQSSHGGGLKKSSHFYKRPRLTRIWAWRQSTIHQKLGKTPNLLAKGLARG